MNDTDKCDESLGAPDAKVVQVQDIKAEKPLMICCFPSSGLVGTIAANTIIEQFDMKEVAFLRSKFIPSAAVFLEGQLKHPFRIHASDEHNLIVVTAEVPVAQQGMYHVSSCLLDWAKSQGVQETVILDGIPVRGMPSDRKVLYASEVEKMKELSEGNELEMLKKGIITGVAGSILSETLSREMTGFALLTPAVAVMPDPKGASMVLKALAKLYDVDIDVSELEDQAEDIRKRLREMAEQVDGMRKQQAQSQGEEFERLYA
jgi:uncharacterized protein (TIGR00161 family)